MPVPSFTSARQSQNSRTAIEFWPAYHGTDAAIAPIVSATKTGRENSRIPDDVSFDYVWTSSAKDVTPAHKNYYR